jgi:hypothetical protein
MRMKPTTNSTVLAEIARKLKKVVNASELDEIARRVKPFISASDSDEVRALKGRCVAAMRDARRGFRKRRAVDPRCERIAATIESVSGMRQYQEPGERSSGKIIREVLIEHQAAWLAPALLESAERGQLAEIVSILDRRLRHRSVVAGQLELINAYTNVLDRQKRAPFIAELLRQLRINKPARTKHNLQEWFRINSRERVIRKTLKGLNLPLSRGKRGRPR